MADLKARILVVKICLLLASQCSGLCQDLDTQACHTMATQDQHFCRDSPLANSVCPKFCKMCPLLCYQCDNLVNKYTDCTSTRECQMGEQCLLHQLTSSKDGHKEYKMNCASLDICDGSGMIQLGRRHINSRNLVTQCCSEDLCNYPGYQQTAFTSNQTTPVTTSTTTTATATTTTTKRTTVSTTTKSPSSLITSVTSSSNLTHCYKDIEFLVEDSRAFLSGYYIRNYLTDIVSSLPIGADKSLVGVALYEHNVDTAFNLGANTNKAGLLHSIQNIRFEHDSNDIDQGDVMEFLHEDLRNNHHGNRANYEDVVVIIEDHFPGHMGRRFLNNKPNLSSAPKDVIVINVGAAGRHSVFSSLASDSSHVIDVDSYSTLATTVQRVLDLICA